MTTAARARKAVARHAAHVASKKAAGLAEPAQATTIEIECGRCEAKEIGRPGSIPEGWLLTLDQFGHDSLLFCADCPPDAETPNNDQAPEQGA